MASAFLEKLNTVVTEVKRRQLDVAVGASWAALATEEDPQGRREGLYRDLLVKAGTEGKGAWWREREGGGGGGGQCLERGKRRSRLQQYWEERDRAERGG